MTEIVLLVNFKIRYSVLYNLSYVTEIVLLVNIKIRYSVLYNLSYVTVIVLLANSRLDLNNVETFIMCMV